MSFNFPIGKLWQKTCETDQGLIQLLIDDLVAKTLLTLLGIFVLMQLIPYQLSQKKANVIYPLDEFCAAVAGIVFPFDMT